MPTRLYAVDKVNVSWDSIIGQDNAKHQLMHAVILPQRYPEIFGFYKKEPTKGILLFGPPGCGKTMFAKALATELASSSANRQDAGFIYIKGPEIFSKWMGESERNVRDIFDTARDFKKRQNRPAVIFIDEADSLLRNRTDDSDVSGGRRDVVAMFLAEMDGLEDTGGIVLLATNRPSMLDSAVVRPGRIDLKIKIGRPNRSEAEKLCAYYLSNIPLHHDSFVRPISSQGSGAGKILLEILVESAMERIYQDDRAYYEVIDNNDVIFHFGLGNLVSGALIAGIVEQAKDLAADRDIIAVEALDHPDEYYPQGLWYEDLIGAVDSVWLQNQRLNHKDALEEFVGKLDQPVQIKSLA